MGVDLVLLNYNDYETTISFLNKTNNISEINHILVVDNNSTNESYKKLKEYENKKINVIKTNKNGGYAYGNNFGINYLIKKYNSNYIIVCNPDIIITSENIGAMISIYSKYKKTGIVSCRMKCTSNIKLPIAWKIPSYYDCIMDNLFILKKFIKSKCYYSSKELDKPVCEVEVLPGSMFMITSDVYKTIGGFDENTFLYFEENILAIKLKNYGFHNYLINNVEYIHNHSVSINKSIKKVNNRLKINFNSKMYYCIKYLNIGFIKKILLIVTFKLGLCSYSIFKLIKRK